MKHLFLFFILISGAVRAEQICMDKKELHAAMLLAGMEGEARRAVEHSINEISLVATLIGSLQGDDLADLLRMLDGMTDSSFAAIVAQMEFAAERGVTVDQYYPRLIGLVETIDEQAKFFPITRAGDGFKAVVERVSDKVRQNN